MLNLKQVCLLYFLIVFASICYAESEINCPPALSPDPDILKAAVLNAKDHGFLWRLSKQGRTSYLYGTIHVGKTDWMFPGPSVRQAINTTDTMALEMDMMDPDIQTRLKTSIETMHANNIPEELIYKIKQQAKVECTPYEILSKMPPEFQMITLELMDGRKSGLETAYAIDLVLAGWGHGAKKNMISLESPEMQIELLLSNTPQETSVVVTESLTLLESGGSSKLLNHIAETWVKSDYEDISKYTEWCECLKTDFDRKLMKKLLDDRNLGLAEHIDALHTSGKQVFAAVGSLHMVGQLGLPALMTARGYSVEKVAF
jgi:uncharacterized protein YbaP (TraB family)